MASVGLHLFGIVIIIAFLLGAAMNLKSLYCFMMWCFYQKCNQCCVFPHKISHSFSPTLKTNVWS